MQNGKKLISLIQWLILSAILTFLDQLSKALILQFLPYAESQYITNFFNLTLIYNSGAAFGFLSTSGDWKHWLFIGLGMLAIFFVPLAIYRHIEKRKYCVGLAFILGGAMGNAMDRFFYGFVIDFLDLHLFDFHWPVFNFADSAIFIGITLLFFYG